MYPMSKRERGVRDHSQALFGISDVATTIFVFNLRMMTNAVPIVTET